MLTLKGLQHWINIPLDENSTRKASNRNDEEEDYEDDGVIVVWETAVQPLTDVQRLIFLSLTILVAIIAIHGNILVLYVNFSRFYKRFHLIFDKLKIINLQKTAVSLSCMFNITRCQWLDICHRYFLHLHLKVSVVNSCVMGRKLLIVYSWCWIKLLILLETWTARLFFDSISTNDGCACKQHSVGLYRPWSLHGSRSDCQRFVGTYKAVLCDVLRINLGIFCGSFKSIADNLRPLSSVHCSTARSSRNRPRTHLLPFLFVRKWQGDFSCTSWIFNSKLIDLFTGWKRIFLRNHFLVHLCATSRHIVLAKFSSCEGSLEAASWRVNQCIRQRKHFDCFDRKHKLCYTRSDSETSWEKTAANQNVQSHPCPYDCIFHLSTAPLDLHSLQARQQCTRQHSLGDQLFTRFDGHGQLHVQSISLHISLWNNSSDDLPCWHCLWNFQSLHEIVQDQETWIRGKAKNVQWFIDFCNHTRAQLHWMFITKWKCYL